MSGKVFVEFIDAAHGTHAAHAECNPDDLPIAFDSDSLVTFEGQEFQVVKAEPATKDEFARSGKLRLWIKRSVGHSVAPKSILFSLPTIENALPATVKDPTWFGTKTIDLHEDEWRQFEFVSLASRRDIAAELEEIRKVLETERGPSGVGYRRLHRRSKIVTPISSPTVPPDDLHRIFGRGAGDNGGISIARTPGIVKNGFGYPLDKDYGLYGVADSGRTTIACLTKGPRDDRPLPNQDKVADLMSRHSLGLAAWPWGGIFLPDGKRLRWVTSL